VAELWEVLQRQAVGLPVGVEDLVDNRVDTVNVSEDGSVWHSRGGSQTFMVTGRYKESVRVEGLV
jgi:photosystem II stability/assembly factor-like uncharacterized protein